MNVKVFQARLDEPFIQSDQESLNQFLNSVTVKKTATQYVPGEPDYWSVLVFYENGEYPKENGKSSRRIGREIVSHTEDPALVLTADQLEIVTALKQWRKDKASATHQPEYLICHNATIEALSRQKPRNLTELEKIKGFGERKIASIGEDVIAVLNAF
ncbi:MAG: HRDC domain-containing protein [Bacteroidota bacterium]|nr:HRDC domain-containing protein [Bacteroidota bacterium]